MRVFRALVVVALVCSSAKVLFAVGSGALGDVPGASGARAMGTGYAFSGVADDPSSIYFNPGGLTQVKGFQFMAGASALSFGAKHTADATTAAAAAGKNDEMASNTPIIPFFYLSYSKKESPWAYGVGVNSPFGLTTEWKDDSFSKYYATKSEILMYAINPTIAYTVSDKISVGAGVDYFNVYKTELNSKAINGGPLADGNHKISGDGTGWGYNLGVHFKANEKHSVGLSYRSQVNVIVKGDEEFTDISGLGALAAYAPSYKTPVETELKFPQSVLLGYGFRPNDRWIFMADYEWVNWNVVTNTPFNRSPSALNNALPASISRNWKNSNNIGLGTEWKAKDWWDVRFGGFAYEQVIPSSTLEASLPEASRWGLNVGSGFHFGTLSLDVAYNHVFVKERTINNNQENATYSQDGTFKPSLDIYSISVSQKWGGAS